MKKQHLKALKLTKRSISNLSIQKLGGRTAKSCGTATCLVCRTYATLCPKCDTNVCPVPTEL